MSPDPHHARCRSKLVKYWRFVTTLSSRAHRVGRLLIWDVIDLLQVRRGNAPRESKEKFLCIRKASLVAMPCLREPPRLWIRHNGCMTKSQKETSRDENGLAAPSSTAFVSELIGLFFLYFKRLISFYQTLMNESIQFPGHGGKQEKKQFVHILLAM